MAAVQNLCGRAMYLKNGLIEYVNGTTDTINYYLADVKRNVDKNLSEIEERLGSGKLQLIDIEAFGEEGDSKSMFLCGEKMRFNIRYKSNLKCGKVKGRIDIGINNFQDVRVAWLSTFMYSDYIDLSGSEISFVIEKLSLMPGSYNVNLYSEIEGEVTDWLSNVFAFDVVESDFYESGRKVPSGQGFILLDYQTIN